MNRPALLVVAAIGATTARGAPLAVGAEGMAGPPAEANVILPDCPAAALGARALLAALELELEYDGIRRISQVSSQRQDDVATIEVALDCEPGANQVRLRVRNAPYQEAHRAMDIADLPRRLRVHAVALAAAELARSTWANSPRPAEVEDAPLVDADASAGKSAQPSGESPAGSKPPPPPPRPATEPPSAKPPDKGPALSPQGRLKRRWLGFAAGPATRWFVPAASPALGGRVAAHIGRLQAGADILYSYDSRFTAATKLGLAIGWAAFDVFARERGSWRLSTGPRLAAGAGWSRTPTSNQESPQGSLLPASPDGQPAAAAGTTRGFFLEGALVVDLLACTAAGWRFTLGMEAGLGWGIAPGRDSLKPSIRPNVGASLLAGHDF